jgi:hypothetical protein
MMLYNILANGPEIGATIFNADCYALVRSPCRCTTQKKKVKRQLGFSSCNCVYPNKFLGLALVGNSILKPMASDSAETQRQRQIQIRNRRKFYLDSHEDYFSPSLELAGPHGRLILSHATDVFCRSTIVRPLYSAISVRCRAGG